MDPTCPASNALIPRNTAINATNTASGDRLESGRTIRSSAAAPIAKPKIMLMIAASHSGTFSSMSGIVHVVASHAMNADRVAISPWAKFRWPVPRNTTTRPRATSA